MHYALYLDEFGHVGPWVSRADRKFNDSIRGLKTIEVCGLFRRELAVLYKKHVMGSIEPQINAILRSLQGGVRADIEHEFRRACALFAPDMPFAALSYDALRHAIADAPLLAAIGQTWPEPARVGR